MTRWGVLAGCAAVVAGAAFVTGATAPPARPAPPRAVAAKADTRPPVVLGQKTGYFNMAKVLRESRRAQWNAQRLNDRRARLSANVLGLRGMYLDLQAAVQRATDPRERDRMGQDLVYVARRAEDADRELNKLLNDRAGAVISGLHDELQAVAAAVAREHGLTALLAYPDAVTAQEAANPAIKELKLKPPALQPFYLDPGAEFSDEIVRRLNERFAAEDEG